MAAKKDIFEALGGHFHKELRSTAAKAAAMVAGHVKDELEGIASDIANGSDEPAPPAKAAAPARRLKGECVCSPTNATDPDGSIVVLHAKACPAR